MDPANGYSSGTTIGGKVGCAVAMLIGLPVFFLLIVFFGFYGHCPPQAACHDGEGLRFMAILLITATIAAASGIAVRWLVNRLQRNVR